MKRIGLHRVSWDDVQLKHVLDDGTTVRYAGEAQLNLGIASVAHLHGWTVEREVVIPGWGRLDLWITNAAGTRSFAIELKQRLDRPALIRKAFQQAEGYRRWIFDADTDVFEMILSAPEPTSDQAAVRTVERLYPGVHFKGVGQVLYLLTEPSTFREEFELIAQRERAHERLVVAQRESALRAAALDRFPLPDLPAPLPDVDVLEALALAEGLMGMSAPTEDES